MQFITPILKDLRNFKQSRIENQFRILFALKYSWQQQNTLNAYGTMVNRCQIIDLKRKAFQYNRKILRKQKHNLPAKN